MAGKESLVERAVDLNKKIDLATIGVGIIAASSAVIFFGMLSYIAGDAIADRLKRKNE